jgi:hypothetical protein
MHSLSLIVPFKYGIWKRKLCFLYRIKRLNRKKVELSMYDIKTHFWQIMSSLSDRWIESICTCMLVYWVKQLEVLVTNICLCYHWWLTRHTPALQSCKSPLKSCMSYNITLWPANCPGLWCVLLSRKENTNSIYKSSIFQFLYGVDTDTAE